MKFKPYEKTKYTAHQPDEKAYITYTAAENAVWHELVHRQRQVVAHRACDDYLHGLDLLQLPEDRVPQCNEISERLTKATGWSVVPVPALISSNEFFTLISRRQFPAASFVRTKEEIDYLEEPDMFHEIFGHCPMLTNPTYADFMQRYGELALKASDEDRELLARLYWFTVEFGLIQTEKGLRVYGGGILSSKNETIYALESTTPLRKPFSGLEALRTPYRIDILQPIYFVIHSFDELYATLSMNIQDTLNKAKALGEYPPLF